jgi:5-methylcytosine-specific restriction endonuclease McrA
MPYSNKEKKREYNKKYYELNKEKSVEYRELNKEKIREKKAEHYQLNKEKIGEKKAEYYQLNKEKKAEYYQLNKEKRVEYKELNREKIREQRRGYRDEKKSYCIEYLGGKCVKCGTIHNLQFDHIKREGKKYEITRKITNKFDTLKEELDKCQLLCAPCHLDKTASEWTK